MKPDECSSVKDEADKKVQRSSDQQELDTSYSEKRESTAEMKAKEETLKDIEETEEKARIGSHNEVVVDDGNNNAKRTRFSSEITIQPKAYFQAGTETVVTMVGQSSILQWTSSCQFVIQAGVEKYRINTQLF